MFNRRLQALRRSNNMTQVKLAELLGVSKGTVAMWETGQRKPNYEMLEKLSDIFDRTIDYIIGHSDNDSPPMMTERDQVQLVIMDTEDELKEIFLDYCALDEFGKTTVMDIIKNEYLRCVKQDTLVNTDDTIISVQIIPPALK